MNIRNAAQVIRDTVSMDQILDLYGYTVKHGFMACPFHGEKTPSLKVYKGSGGWHCFGCGRGGSVIDFVTEHENCDFRTAVHAIDGNLKLNLFPENEDPYELEDQMQEQLKLDAIAKAFYDFCDGIRDCVDRKLRVDLFRMKTARDKGILDRTAEDWMILLTFDEESKHNEYLLDKIEELREEVKEWRRTVRGVR